MTALFLLPHQDDEFGVFKILADRAAADEPSICIYLTDGAANGHSTRERDNESRKVLSRIGINDPIFVRDEVRARDGNLVDVLPEIFKELTDVLSRHKISAVYAPSWEGGHPDHDAAALLAPRLASAIGASRVVSFPLYNAYEPGLLPFSFFRPIPKNGIIETTPVASAEAVSHLKYCTMYASQRKTWRVLLPAMAWHYLTERCQITQTTDIAAFDRRPHASPLFYERRNWLTWGDFQRRANRFRSLLH